MKLEVILREYQKSEPIELTPEQYHTLRHYHELISIIGGQKIGYYQLEASSWIGQILLPNMKIIIEPKIGGVDVLKMIIGGDGEANPRELASIIKSGTSLWDIIASGMINETLGILQKGLRHQFINQIDLLTSPKGKIEFYDDFKANTPIRKGIVCEFDEFSPSIPENLAIKWGLEVLEQLASKNKIEQLRRVISLLYSVPSTHSPPQFILPNSNDLYFRALWLVKLIDRGIALNMSHHGIKSSGFGVDMNKVFEGFVRNQLRIAARSSSIRIAEKFQAKKDLCPQVKLEPDILITHAGNPLIIADCKYKIDWSKNNADIYQMLAYLEGFRPVHSAIIFCPSSGEFKEEIIQLPRNRELRIVKLSMNHIFDEDVWKKIIIDLEKVVYSNNSKIA